MSSALNQSPPPKTYRPRADGLIAMSPEEYLEFRHQIEEPYEYWDGYARPKYWDGVRALASPAPDHGYANGDLYRMIGNALEDSPCNELNSEFSVKTNERLPNGKPRYLIPDASIVCGEPEFDEDLLVNPTVVFEVLSPSTEHHDRSEKLRLYFDLPSVDSIVLISVKRVHVEVYRRDASGDLFQYRFYTSLDDEVELPAAGIALPIQTIYRRVDLAPPEESDPRETPDASEE